MSRKSDSAGTWASRTAVGELTEIAAAASRAGAQAIQAVVEQIYRSWRTTNLPEPQLPRSHHAVV